MRRIVYLFGILLFTTIVFMTYCLQEDENVGDRPYDITSNFGLPPSAVIPTTTTTITTTTTTVLTYPKAALAWLKFPTTVTNGFSLNAAKFMPDGYCWAVGGNETNSAIVYFGGIVW